jgi:pyruvate dehydrogenase E2 component (dihydrolipoamide acetyltransferase)
VNAALDEKGENIILKNYYNIGVAIDTEDGLVVPVVKDADRKSILEIAADIQRLSDKARSRKLALEDVQGSTFSVTNAGNIGGLMATPIINWPEVAILGVHKISKRPVVKDGQIIAADMLWLSVAIDHRVVDGAMAARFMNVVLDYLSHPGKLMMDSQ